MMRTVAFWACLAVALVAACFASQTPKPVAANAPASQFSAMRAFRDVQVVAARPHPTGSAEHAQVRGYLLSRMRALGLETRVQESRAFETADDAEDGRYVSGADLVNLIGLLPGRDRSLPALAVMSHYDSVPASPGAADDTTGVASALEVARAMKAGRQPARDVVFLITDGEEIGLLGARAFYRDDPLAKRIGAVINMESRGGGGRVYMFQTSARNGALIDVFRRSAVNPSSNSLATFLYANMPNDTDMTVTNQAGKIGLNYAFIGSQFDYHAASSTPANLDKGSLQHMGSQVLAATRSLADAPTLPAPAADTIYGDVLGGPIIVYPAMAGWLILLVSALLIGAAVWRARGVETLSPVGVAKGAGAGLYILLVSAVAFAAIRFATGIPRGFTDQRPLLAQFPLFEAAMALAALAVFVLSIWNLKRGARWVAAVAAPLVLAALTLFGGVQMVPLGMGVGAAVIAALVFRRAAPGWSAWTGVLLLGLILGVTLQALAPPASLVVSWPLLAASVFAAAIAFGGGGRSANPVSSLAGLVIGAAVTAELLYIGHSVVIGVGADLPSAPSIFVLLLALCLAPLAWASSSRILLYAGVAAAVAVVGLVLFLRFGDASSPRHPAASQVLYVADAETGKALLATAMRHPDAWTRAVLAADGGTLKSEGLAPVTRWGFTAPAKPVAAVKPEVTVTKTADGRVEVRMPPVAEARELRLRVNSQAALADVIVNGLPLKPADKAEHGFTAIWANPRDGLTVSFKASSPGGADLRFAVITDGWPSDARPLPARPADVMPWGQTDLTAVTGGQRATW